MYSWIYSEIRGLSFQSQEMGVFKTESLHAEVRLETPGKKCGGGSGDRRLLGGPELDR